MAKYQVKGAEQFHDRSTLHKASVAQVPVSSEGHVYTGPIANGYWTDAADLMPGYRLLNDDASWAEVVSVEVEAEPLRAFNLTVDKSHTYFVRAANTNAAPVWVHNNCHTGYHPEGFESAEQFQEAVDGFKAVGPEDAEFALQGSGARTNGDFTKAAIWTLGCRARPPLMICKARCPKRLRMVRMNLIALGR